MLPSTFSCPTFWGVHKVQATDWKAVFGNRTPSKRQKWNRFKCVLMTPYVYPIKRYHCIQTSYYQLKMIILTFTMSLLRCVSKWLWLVTRPKPALWLDDKIVELSTILKHFWSGLPRFYLSGIVLDESHNRTEAGFHCNLFIWPIKSCLKPYLSVLVTLKCLKLITLCIFVGAFMF